MLQKLVHFLTALTIFLKAVTKLEDPEGYWPLIILLFAASAYIVFITLMHERLHRHAQRIDASVYAIESAVMAIVAWLFFGEGKTAIASVYVLASIGFAIALIVRLTRRSALTPH
jgi:tryptophan-rich sensory protein